jgi:hypothetical protein
MCNSTTCPLRTGCYRHAASGTVPNPAWQAYASFLWNGGDPARPACAYHWPLTTGGGMSQSATLGKAQPLIHALRTLGHRVLVDAAEHDLQSTWLDVGPLCVQVHPDRGYGLYLDGDKAFRSGPDELFAFGQIEALLERMVGLLEAP